MADLSTLKVPSAEELNAIIAEGKAKESGTGNNDGDQPLEFSKTVNIAGQDVTFVSDSAEGALAQANAALEAANRVLQASPKPDEKKTETVITPDPTKLFQIGQDLMTGKPEAIERYIRESGLIDRYLAEKGIKIEDVKRTMETTVSNQTAQQATETVKEWVQSEDAKGYPGGVAVEKLMKVELTEISKGKPITKDMLNQAWTNVKGYYTPQATEQNGEPTTKRKATSSSAFGTGAEPGTRQPRVANPTTINLAEFNKLTPAARNAVYNDAVLAAGGDPKKVTFVQ